MSGSRPLQIDCLWGLTVERVLSEGIWFDVVMDRFEEEGNGFGWRTCGNEDRRKKDWKTCENEVLG